MTGKVAKRSFALEATDLPSSPSGNCNDTNGILRYYCIPPDNNWKSIVFNHAFARIIARYGLKYGAKGIQGCARQRTGLCFRPMPRLANTACGRK